MDNKRIEKGALFDSKNLCYRCRIKALGRKPDNGFGRESDRFSAANAFASSLNRIRIVGCKNFGFHRLNRLSRNQMVSIQTAKGKSCSAIVRLGIWQRSAQHFSGLVVAKLLQTFFQLRIDQ